MIEQLPADLARWVGVLGPARQLAEVLAGTDFVPKGMRGNPDAVTAAIMYGDELGLGPMQALAGLDVVEGKPRPSAELARALILRAGHTMVVHEATGTRVRVSGKRAGADEAERVTVEWTMDMARAAGLVNKSNWRSYPRAMLMARATGDLARILFPDVIKGLGYVAETDETATTMEAWAPVAEVAPPVAPPVPAIQRKRRPRAAAGEEGSAPGGPHERPSPHGPNVPGPDALVPEADPVPEVIPDDARITDAQRRAVFAAIGKVMGTDAQRWERLALCSAIVGRELATTNDMTNRDASSVLAWLDDYRAKRVSYVTDYDESRVAIVAVGDPPGNDDGQPDLDGWSDP